MKFIYFLFNLTIFLLYFTTEINSTMVCCSYEINTDVSMDDLKNCSCIIWSITGTQDISVRNPFPGNKFCNSTKNIIGKTNNTKHFLKFGDDLNAEDVLVLKLNFHSRLILIASILEIIQNCGFTGVLLDFPKSFSGSSYCYFLTELNNALDYKGFRYEMEIFGNFSIVLHNDPCSNELYLCDWNSLSHLQYIFFSGQNLKHSSANETRHIAPLYSEEGHASLNTTVQCFVTNENIPKEKLVVTLFAYGMSYLLADPNNTAVGARIESTGQPNTPTANQPDLLSRDQICGLLLSDAGAYHWDELAKSPYAVNKTNGEWITFEDRKSIAAKTKWAKDNHMGGVLIWNSRLDDFYNECGKGKFPLLSAAMKAVLDDEDEYRNKGIVKYGSPMEGQYEKSEVEIEQVREQNVDLIKQIKDTENNLSTEHDHKGPFDNLSDSKIDDEKVELQSENQEGNSTLNYQEKLQSNDTQISEDEVEKFYRKDGELADSNVQSNEKDELGLSDKERMIDDSILSKNETILEDQYKQLGEDSVLFPKNNSSSLKDNKGNQTTDDILNEAVQKLSNDQTKNIQNEDHVQESQSTSGTVNDDSLKQQEPQFMNENVSKTDTNDKEGEHLLVPEGDLESTNINNTENINETSDNAVKETDTSGLAISGNETQTNQSNSFADSIKQFFKNSLFGEGNKTNEEVNANLTKNEESVQKPEDMLEKKRKEFEEQFAAFFKSMMTSNGSKQLDDPFPNTDVPQNHSSISLEDQIMSNKSSESNQSLDIIHDKSNASKPENIEVKEDDFFKLNQKFPINSDNKEISEADKTLKLNETTQTADDLVLARDEILFDENPKETIEDSQIPTDHPTFSLKEHEISQTNTKITSSEHIQNSTKINVNEKPDQFEKDARLYEEHKHLFELAHPSYPSNDHAEETVSEKKQNSKEILLSDEEKSNVEQTELKEGVAASIDEEHNKEMNNKSEMLLNEEVRKVDEGFDFSESFKTELTETLNDDKANDENINLSMVEDELKNDTNIQSTNSLDHKNDTDILPIETWEPLDANDTLDMNAQHPDFNSMGNETNISEDKQMKGHEQMSDIFSSAQNPVESSVSSTIGNRYGSPQINVKIVEDPDAKNVSSLENKLHGIQPGNDTIPQKTDVANDTKVISKDNLQVNTTKIDDKITESGVDDTAVDKLDINTTIHESKANDQTIVSPVADALEDSMDEDDGWFSMF